MKSSAYYFGPGKPRAHEKSSWEPVINRCLQTIILMGMWITIIYIAVRVNNAVEEHIIKPKLPQKAENALNGFQKIQDQIDTNTMDQVKRVIQRADEDTAYIEQHKLLPMTEMLANEIHQTLATFAPSRPVTPPS